jgi:hypothetical protein
VFRWGACSGSVGSSRANSEPDSGASGRAASSGKAAAFRTEAGAAGCSVRSDTDAADCASSVHARIWACAYVRAWRAAADLRSGISVRADTDNAASYGVSGTQRGDSRRVVQETADGPHQFLIR